MKSKLAVFMAAMLCLSVLSVSVRAGAEEQDWRPRIIITTDGEYDDQCSMIRLIMYSDVLDIEALILGSAECHWKGDGEHTQREIEPHFKGSDAGDTAGDLYEYRYQNGDKNNNWLRSMILEDYAEVWPNLRVHSPSYPTPGDLFAVLYFGNIEFEGDVRFETEGSNKIVECMLDDDPRPLIICSWGGFNTVARAFISVEERYRDTEEWDEIYAKIIAKVIIAGHGQDYTWDDHMELWRDDLTQASGGGTWNYFMTRDYAEYLDGDFWLNNIKFGHGPLMADFYTFGDGLHQDGEYEDLDYTPAAKVGISDELPYGYQHGEARDLTTYHMYGHNRVAQNNVDRYHFITEGDSGSYVWAIPLGPNAMNNQAGSIAEAMKDLCYGTWGGRLSLKEGTNYYTNVTGDYDPLLGYESSAYNGGRYNDDMLNDLATRADWCVTPKYEDANHRPVITVEERNITAAPGEVLYLTCKAEDPDGDGLIINWFQYQEAGTYARQFVLPDPSAETIRFAIPKDAVDGDVIVMQVEAKDDGEHPLVDYAQVIITVSVPAAE